MHRKQVDLLDARLPHWAVAVEAPVRDWSAMPGCRANARFLIDPRLLPSVTEFEHFDSRAECLAWIMVHRSELADHLPGAKVHPVELASWLLGLS